MTRTRLAFRGLLVVVGFTLPAVADDPPGAPSDQYAFFDQSSSQIKDKPPQVIEKIVQGKIDKFLSSICLLEQGFIKDPETTIERLYHEMYGTPAAAPGGVAAPLHEPIA